MLVWIYLTSFIPGGIKRYLFFVELHNLEEKLGD